MRNSGHFLNFHRVKNNSLETVVAIFILYFVLSSYISRMLKDSNVDSD